MIIISRFESASEKSIGFKSANLVSFNKYRFGSLSVKDRKNPIFYADSMDLDFSLLNLFGSTPILKISLNNAKFYGKNILDEIFQMLSMKDTSFAGFDRVGFMLICGEDIILKDLKAENKSLTIKAEGLLKKDESLDFDIMLTFSKGTLKEMPESLKKTISEEAKRGEGSVDFKIRGNLKNPSISIKTNFFEQNQIRLEVSPVIKNE